MTEEMVAHSAMSGAAPRTAQADEHPCALYKDHGSSYPVMTEGHHVNPEYLQRRVWGKVMDETLIYLCGTCHTNVHAWLYYLCGEWRKPTLTPPPRARALAERTFRWYIANGGEVKA